MQSKGKQTRVIISWVGYNHPLYAALRSGENCTNYAKVFGGAEGPRSHVFEPSSKLLPGR